MFHKKISETIKQVKNELVENGLEKAEVYTDLGLKYLQPLNYDIVFWVQQQSFAHSISELETSYVYQSMIVSGSSEHPPISGSNINDSVQWDLNFSADGRKNKDGAEKFPGFSDGLLHIKNRTPDVTSFNSAPDLFHPFGYFQIRVFNGERGWVKNGTLPKNVHKALHRDESQNESTFQDLPPLKKIPVYTDIKRDAIAGFNAAKDWAKYRAMALASVGYLKQLLIKERASFKEHNPDWGHNFNAADAYKSRSQNAGRLFLDLLPDVRTTKGATALRPYYEPGFLEGVLASELEKGLIDYNLRSARDDTDRGISSVHGDPIQIISTQGKGAYDARFVLNIDPRGSISGKDENLAKIVTDILRPYVNIYADDSLNFKVIIDVPEAHKVVAAIKEGANDTYLHIKVQSLNNILAEVSKKLNDWSTNVKPTIEAGYKSMLTGAQEKHFGELKQIIRYNPHISQQKSK